MAEDQGIHPEVMKHIIDLHRKHSELQMQMHDKESGDGEPHEVFQKLLATLEKLNANIEKLIPAVDADTKADKGEGKNERRRERAGASSASGKAASEA